MTSALELTAKGADVAPRRIEHKDRGMIRLFDHSLVNHIQESIPIDRHVVRRLPSELFGKLRPLMVDLVSILTIADDQGRVCFARRDDMGCCEAGHGSRCGGLQKSASWDDMFLCSSHEWSPHEEWNI